MFEKLRIQKRIVDRIEGTLLRPAVARSLGSIFSTPHKAVERLPRQLNVEFDYLQHSYGEDYFEGIRKRLNTEPGVIIANHPESLDVVSVMNMIERPDILAMVSPSGYKYLAPIFGKRYFLETTDNPTVLREQFRQIDAHIQSGGLFMLLPTGGDERRGSFLFRDGFRLLVEKILRPSDMVYVAWTEPEDLAALRNERVSRTIGALSEFVIGGNTNLNSLKERKRIRVDEQYSKASEWQDAIKGQTSRIVKNKILTDHFLCIMGKTVKDTCAPLSQPNVVRSTLSEKPVIAR